MQKTSSWWQRSRPNHKEFQKEQYGSREGQLWWGSYRNELGHNDRGLHECWGHCIHKGAFVSQLCFFFSFSKVCLTDVSFSSVRWSRRVRSTKDTCVSVEKWVKYMSILLYSWRGAVDPAAKTAEVRRHDTFKESNSRLVHYTTATTELSFCTVLSSFMSVFP